MIGYGYVCDSRLVIEVNNLYFDLHVDSIATTKEQIGLVREIHVQSNVCE